MGDGERRCLRYHSASQKERASKLLLCEKVDFPPQAGSALTGRDIMRCRIGQTFTALEKKIRLGM